MPIHIFAQTGESTNRHILDSFKTLLKDSRWPMMLILSGVPDLAQHIQKEEQPPACCGRFAST